jgi:hypothetical protein
MRGIYVYMASIAGELNLNNVNISNNAISLLTLDPDESSIGIDISGFGYMYDTRVSDNFIAANLLGISADVQSSLITGNRIFSKGYGIYVQGSSVEVSTNNVICQTDRSDGAGVSCIRTRQYFYQGIDVLNNTTFLKGNGSTGVLKGDGSFKLANIYVYEGSKNFTISGNITRQYYSSIDGADQAAHIYVGEYHQAFWSIDNNQIFNVNVKGAGTVSDSDGLYVDTSIVAGERGVIANNCIFGSNSTLVGTHTELAVSATAGIVTLNNNRIVINYTGPGIETATIALVGSVTMETITTNIVDKYNAGGVYAGLAF